MQDLGCLDRPEVLGGLRRKHVFGSLKREQRDHGPHERIPNITTKKPLQRLAHI